MLISIVIPCYNEEKTVARTLASVFAQSFGQWEAVVVDDGSADHTAETVRNVLGTSPFGDKVRLISEVNQDQLLAVRRGLEEVRGDYIYILHGDDLFYDEKTLEHFAAFAEENPGFDAYMAPHVLIDGDERDIGPGQPLKDYMPAERSLPLMQLWLGRNLFCDSAFFERKAFIEHVSLNYLLWDMPFWTKLAEEAPGKRETLRVKRLDRPVFRYRIHEGNYMNSVLGGANVLSGEIRTFLNLAADCHIPAYKLQYFLFRAVNKLLPKKTYRPLFKPKRQKNISDILRFIISKSPYASELFSQEPFKTQLDYFAARQNREELHVKIPPLSPGFFAPLGAEMRILNRKVLEQKLSPEEIYFLDCLKRGPNKLSCRPDDHEPVARYLKYLGLDPYIEIHCERES